ncbi:MAG: hypothetical protein K9M07_02225 [Simkaniaceae bacterium]|nr:hypothetical protein [Simkaniaceae bacterium]
MSESVGAMPPSSRAAIDAIPFLGESKSDAPSLSARARPLDIPLSPIATNTTDRADALYKVKYRLTALIVYFAASIMVGFMDENMDLVNGAPAFAGSKEKPSVFDPLHPESFVGNLKRAIQNSPHISPFIRPIIIAVLEPFFNYCLTAMDLVGSEFYHALIKKDIIEEFLRGSDTQIGARLFESLNDLFIPVLSSFTQIEKLDKSQLKKTDTCHFAEKRKIGETILHILTQSHDPDDFLYDAAKSELPDLDSHYSQAAKNILQDQGFSEEIINRYLSDRSKTVLPMAMRKSIAQKWGISHGEWEIFNSIAIDHLLGKAGDLSAYRDHRQFNSLKLTLLARNTTAKNPIKLPDSVEDLSDAQFIELALKQYDSLKSITETHYQHIERRIIKEQVHLATVAQAAGSAEDPSKAYDHIRTTIWDKQIVLVLSDFAEENDKDLSELKEEFDLRYEEEISKTSLFQEAMDIFGLNLTEEQVNSVPRDETLGPLVKEKTNALYKNLCETFLNRFLSKNIQFSTPPKVIAQSVYAYFAAPEGAQPIVAFIRNFIAVIFSTIAYYYQLVEAPIQNLVINFLLKQFLKENLVTIMSSIFMTLTQSISNKNGLHGPIYELLNQVLTPSLESESGSDSPSDATAIEPPAHSLKELQPVIDQVMLLLDQMLDTLKSDSGWMDAGIWSLICRYKEFIATAIAQSVVSHISHRSEYLESVEKPILKTVSDMFDTWDDQYGDDAARIDMRRQHDKFYRETLPNTLKNLAPKIAASTVSKMSSYLPECAVSTHESISSTLSGFIPTWVSSAITGIGKSLSDGAVSQVSPMIESSIQRSLKMFLNPASVSAMIHKGTQYLQESMHLSAVKVRAIEARCSDSSIFECMIEEREAIDAGLDRRANPLTRITQAVYTGSDSRVGIFRSRL